MFGRSSVTISLVLVLTIFGSLPQKTTCQIDPDLLIQMQKLLSATDLPSLQTALVGVIEDEYFEGIPIDPSLAKAFVMTTDMFTFMRTGFDFQKVFDAIFNNKDVAEAFIGTLKFDVLQKVILVN